MDWQPSARYSYAYMSHLPHLYPFVHSDWRRSLAALALLTAGVFMDLAVPRLAEPIIDGGITPQDHAVVVQSSRITPGMSPTWAPPLPLAKT